MATTYRWCLVPRCKNTTINTPEKLFVSVPLKPKTRKVWLETARRDPNDISATSNMYICEDHFDMEKDMANYQQYKMGFSKKILMVEGVVPSKFQWLDKNKNKMSRENILLSERVKQKKITPIQEVQPVATTQYPLEIPKIEPTDESMDTLADTEEVYERKCDIKTEYPNLTSTKLELDEEIEVKRENYLFSEQFVDEDVKCDYLGPTSSHLTNNNTDILPSELKKHKCGICSYTSHKKSDIRFHIDSVHLKLQIYECDSCNFVTNKKAALESHIGVHINSRKYQCHGCKKKFNRKTKLRYHIELVHLNMKSFHCDRCDYATHKISELKIHVDGVHLNFKEYKCVYCDHGTNRKADLLKHVKNVHLNLNLKRFKCNRCEYASTTSHLLKKHIEAVHLNLRGYVCVFCNFASSYKANLSNHIEKRHFKQERIK